MQYIGLLCTVIKQNILAVWLKIGLSYFDVTEVYPDFFESLMETELLKCIVTLRDIMANPGGNHDKTFIKWQRTHSKAHS